MINPRFAPALFALLLSGMMSLIVSGVATLRALGLRTDFVELWLQAWSISWAIAFPTVFVVGPFVRRVVTRLTTPQA